MTDKYHNMAVCKGSWALGTACGRCQRCIDTKILPVVSSGTEMPQVPPRTEVRVEIETTTRLTLNVEEAAWLKGWMQNPIGVAKEDEPPRDSEIRARFWHALGGR